MEQQNGIIKIAPADDHVLLRNALARLVAGFDNCTVIFEAGDGTELTGKMTAGNLSHIVLLDVNMPCMHGFETAAWLRNKYPAIRILVLTMYDGDQALIRLLQYGVKGFLKKDIHPSELNFAIRAVAQNGFYSSQKVSGKMADLFRNGAGNVMTLERNLLNEQEIIFLNHSSSDLTYKEIALKMKLSPRAVDNLRDNLFKKPEVKSRVGLAMYAIRQGLVAS
jgi:two-component system invasion response regulator UvrY